MSIIQSVRLIILYYNKITAKLHVNNGSMLPPSTQVLYLIRGSAIFDYSYQLIDNNQRFV